jgi:hypothetical protein
MSLLTGLVAHWPLNGTTWDASGNGHDGTLQNSPTFVGDGPCGGGVLLNGSNQCVIIPSSADLNVAPGATIAAWVRTTSTATQLIFGGYQTSSPYAGYGFIMNLGSANHLDYWSGTGSWNGGAGGSVTDGNWHLVAAEAVTTGGGNNGVWTFVDGQLVGGALAGTYSSWVGQRAIGATSDGTTGNFFNGVIGGVSLWNRTLTVEEHAQLFASPGYPWGIGRMGRPLGRRIIVP